MSKQGKREEIKTQGCKREETKEDKEKREKSSEEIVRGIEIQTVEKNSLDKVFDLLYGKNLQHEIDKKSDLLYGNNQKHEQKQKDGKESKEQQKKQLQEEDKYFTSHCIAQVLDDLDYQTTKPEIERMIWEVDENLNGQIDRYEFELMYKRCSHDKSGLEPRSLYNVVQFLMFLQSQTLTGEELQNNKLNKKKITVEDTLELLYVRYGRLQLDQEIEEIFGTDNRQQEGQEKEISLHEFLQKIKKKDQKFRKAMKYKRQDVDPKKQERKDDYYFTLQ